MSFFHKMIRTSRVFYFGKNFWEAPLFSQRTASLSKQVSVKFSVANKEEESTFNVPTKLSHASNKFTESYKEIKYAFLRQIFNGKNTDQKSLGIFKPDTALDQFFIDLPALSPPEIIKILKLLSETNNRPIASIKALCAVLDSQNNWSYTVIDCCNLLYSLARLSYRDEKLIKIAAENLKKSDDFHSPRVAGIILFSLGDLRFRDCQLLDKLLKYVLLNAHHIKVSLNCLRAASFLNYQSKEVEELIKFLSHLKELDFIQSNDYVNFIWVSVMLNKLNFLTNEQISKVLSEEFVTRILNNGIHPATKWKLLNINGAVKQLKDYNGPFLNDHSQYKIMSLSLPKQKSTILESVLDTLSYVVPQSASLKPLVNVGAGFYLDFEFCEEPQKSEENKSSKTGILLLNYNDICSDDTLSGIPAFKVNILKGLGYKVVLIKHSEYCPSDPLSQKIEFLRNKIQNVDVKLTQTNESCLFKKQ